MIAKPQETHREKNVSIVFRGVILDTNREFSQMTDFYSYLLGEPEFIDGESWAPFAPAGDISVSLAGQREATGTRAALTFKVSDLEAVCDELCARGGSSSREITEGLHQKQLKVTDPAGNIIVLYASLTLEGE